MAYNKNLLENLFGPKAKVLKLFFHQPNLVLTEADIGKKSCVKRTLRHRLVADLIKLGVLKKASRNGKKKKK